MKNIEVKVMNPWAVNDAEKMEVCAARLTQCGEKIKSMWEFEQLYGKNYKAETLVNMCKLPHPTIQKFSVINVVVVGASRRFLAQITRHQNEVKFMSASLQYSDYAGEADFVIPYELMDKPDLAKQYISSCSASMREYELLEASGIDHDTTGYLMPQGLRNVLIISATPYEWKHMISQRICRRNTTETRYVMLKIWERLYKLSPEMFAPDTTGPFCMKGGCQEGDKCCGHKIDAGLTPTQILAIDFPKLTGGKT